MSSTKLDILLEQLQVDDCRKKNMVRIGNSMIRQYEKQRLDVMAFVIVMGDGHDVGDKRRDNSGQGKTRLVRLEMKRCQLSWRSRGHNCIIREDKNRSALVSDFMPIRRMVT